MVDFRPFRGLRFDPAVAGDPADLVAPPYDVIDGELQSRLYRKSPYNVVRLILGRESDRYEVAAVRFAEWRRKGVLVPEAEPVFYVYVQDFSCPISGRPLSRTGVVGALRLEPFESGWVRPHERTLPKAKEDRLRLLEACRANLCPIFGLYPEDLEVLEPTRRALEAELPAVDVSDEEGCRHRLWPLREERRAREIERGLSAQWVLIADGHHRYETALAFRDRLRERGELSPDHPANFVLAYLCSMRDPGLVVLPTHRVLVDSGRSTREFARELSSVFEVRTCEEPLPPERAEASPEGSEWFGAALRDGPFLLLRVPDSEALGRLLPEFSPEVRRMAVVVLDRVVFSRMLGVEASEAASEGRLRYTRDFHEALEQVRAGRAHAAFFVPPPGIDAIRRAAESGQKLPEKTTFFVPKLLSGLVFRPLE
ncbi:MAG: phosphatase [Candidatus Binatia bacterium]|nr:MAG: phosphatase [Candidatus Binatia bacterium]